MGPLLYITALALLANISTTLANPIQQEPQSSRPSDSVANCVDYKISLTVTSENLVINTPQWKNDFELIDYLQNSSAKNANVTFHPIGPTTINVTESVSIAATFCSPKTPSASKQDREKTVLITSSGLAYDSRYWDSEYNPSKYSFVEAAVAQGYSVFNYDRLGVGQSQKVSGWTNQASIQVEILASLIQLVRNGNYTGPVGKAKSIVAVGHSFGSQITNVLLTKYPSIVDAAILTGDAYESIPYGGALLEETIEPRIANQLDPKIFGELDTGYLTFVDIYAHVNFFFKAPFYEISAVQYAQSIAQPFALLEFLSTAAYSLKAPEYEGSLFMMAGEFDIPACLGDCVNTFRTQNLTEMFPKSRLIDTYILPGAGHGVNFASNVGEYYGETWGFLKKAGF
ncbi:alpha/beta-hydrolase [Microthyrium microscopicum]|uniref:Alpha/beta-hydrolase n=1 Tax=Microthyrium microscopicum TaxID=703497 RepID=A0A6A6TTT5_9PEZI|nr:alpha/beta-hydrolase [Microthyrium microscopicum]